MFNNGVRIITLISIPRSPPTPGREEREVKCVCVCERERESKRDGKKKRKRGLYTVPIAKTFAGCH